MTYAERKEKEKYLLYLIQKERLVSIEKVSNDFNCSKRTVKRMLCGLRDEGYKIYYCKVRCKYLLEN